jgi:3-methyladenine DNA glycosylase Mpg
MEEEVSFTENDIEIISPKTETILESEFFQQNILQVSQDILGKVLVHKLSNGSVISGRIIETEGNLSLFK